jgi:hypothetical protein
MGRNNQDTCRPSCYLLSVFRFLRLLMSGHQAVAIENAALRLQLVAFQRKRKRPVLTTFDRAFWIALRRLWSGWRSVVLCPGRHRHPLATRTISEILGAAVQIVWSSSGPARYRGRGSAIDRTNGDRQSVVAGTANSRRIEDARHLDLRAHRLPNPAPLPRPPSQTWKTFLHNHLG